MKLFKKYLKMLKDKNYVWTENNIRSFRKAIGFSSSLPPEERMLLWESFDGPYDITHQQTEKGINYLLEKAFKKNGEPRQTKDFPFTDRELNILKHFTKFKFVGVEGEYNKYLNTYINFKPVYRVISTKGNFDYIAGTFGSIEVIK